MKLIKSWINRGITFVIAVIIVLLIADFNQKLSELSSLKDQMANDGALLDELIGKRDELLVLKDYAASDKAVEDFARQEGYMAKPGDTVFVVKPLSEFTEENDRKIYSGFDDDQSNLEKWFFWLIGD